MKIKILFLWIVILGAIFILFSPILSKAEVKENMDSDAPGKIIPKLTEEETKDPPVLMEGKVYPFWGPVCQRYTYSVIYKDQDGRAPEYIKIYFNGQMIDMEKENPDDNNYQKGVKYIYKNVPTKLGSNFYYFESSNGVGKARDSIIDSPDNGPVLFASDFSKNEIVLIDKEKNEIAWRYEVGKEWIGGVALSDDGKYLAAQSSHHIYLFDSEKSEPLWTYEANTGSPIGGDVKGGIDISSDGSKIFATIGGKSLLFDKKSNKPLWEYSGSGQISGNAYNVAISDDGNFAASAMAGGGECELNQSQCQAKDVLIFWNTNSKNPLWKYQTEGNFHDVSLSADGNYLSTATGCPDRRAYIFSRNSNEPLIKSEMLTHDSPVDESIISADGSLAAFGTESSDGAVFLFSRDSQYPLWKFAITGGASVRALGFTPDGKYIGASTMLNGNVYIFSQDSNQPTDSWQIENTSLGALDIADDGSYLAVGGTDKKVHLFTRDKSEQDSEFTLNEFIGELDISGNGKYIVAGTSGSVYFFETLSNNNQETECAEIIEPDPEPTSTLSKDASDDIESNQSEILGLSFLTVIFGSIFLALLICLTIYIIICKKHNHIYNKSTLVVLIVLIVVCFTLALFFEFKQQPNDIDKKDNASQTQTTSGSENQSGSQEAKCGDGLCTPDFGESQTSCPQDCNAED